MYIQSLLAIHNVLVGVERQVLSRNFIYCEKPSAVMAGLFSL